MMNSISRKKILSGNEAIARGAIESQIGFCASYPGTPSTEIASTLMDVAEKYNIYTEWSTNEKVALEASAGASWAGVPALCSLKSLGLNVAADFLLNLNLSGSGSGGLVIVVCDDPQGHSSSNEQDSRFYAKSAYLPLLEPSTCQEAKDMIPYAFNLSKSYQIPVFLRSTTRLSHSRAIITLGEIRERTWKVEQDLPQDLFNVPAPFRKHRELLEKNLQISKEFDECSWNRLSIKKNSDLVIISSGTCDMYVREALEILDIEDVIKLELGASYPLPTNLVTSALQSAKMVLFAEEVDPFIEDEVLALSSLTNRSQTKFYGKRNHVVPAWGETSTDTFIEAIAGILDHRYNPRSDTISSAAVQAKKIVVKRPLTFCAGCTHRNVYWAIQKVKKRINNRLIVTGDIGCYSLGVFYRNSMNTMQAMGSGIGTASGLGQLDRFGFETKVIAVAGDSTFFHACLPGLISARHHNANLTFIILDNATTAMTGFQTHPGSSTQKPGLQKVSIEDLVLSIKPDFFSRGDATDIPALIDLIHTTLQKKGLKVLLLDSICRLEERKRRESYDNETPISIDTEQCKGDTCRICAGQFGCLALNWNIEIVYPEIIEDQCVRCGACVDVCPHHAIKQG
jgi:indolepyruvate ferredoxin oxidoreductase alpha subunit